MFLIEVSQIKKENIILKYNGRCTRALLLHPLSKKMLNWRNIDQENTPGYWIKLSLFLESLTPKFTLVITVFILYEITHSEIGLSRVVSVTIA